MKRLVLIILAALLFPLSYGICELMYPFDDIKWDHLRHDLYSLNLIIAVLVLSFEKDDKYEKFVYLISHILIVGMITPSLIDKVFFDDRDFHWVDLVFIVISIITGCKKVFYNYYEKCLCQTKMWKF